MRLAFTLAVLLLAGCSSPAATLPQPTAASTSPSNVHYAVYTPPPTAPPRKLAAFLEYDIFGQEAHGAILHVEVPVDARNVTARLEHAASATTDISVALAGCGSADLGGDVHFGDVLGPAGLCRSATQGNQQVTFNTTGVSMGHLVLEADVPA